MNRKEHQGENKFIIPLDKISEQSEKLRKRLLEMKASPKEVASTILLLEEVIVRLYENGGQTVKVKIQKQFGDVTVESILTSRMDVAAIDINMPQEEILQFIKEQNHSRLPVYEGTIDNIIGILHIRRYIRYYIRKGEALDIKPLLYEPFFIHQSTKIDDLLTIMSRKKINIAVVTDNYGGTLGIVTDEDILEELVGEIWDEDDRAVRNVVPMTDGSYSVNPEEDILDVLDELGMEYSEDDEQRIGHKLMNELAYEAFPSIPVAGDSFHFLGTKISVLVMRHNRIMRLKVRKLTKEELKEDRRTAENDENPENVKENYEGFAKGEPYAVHQSKGKHYARAMSAPAKDRG